MAAPPASATSASGQVFIPGGNVNVVADLAALLAPIADQHFPVDKYTVPAINAAFLTTKMFMNAARFFCAMPDLELRRSVVQAAVAANLFRAAVCCSVKEFYKFCKWLKSPAGVDVLAEARKRRKLKGRAYAGQTLEEVGLVSAFNEQKSEFAKSLEEMRAKHDAYLAELRKMMKLAEEAKEIHLHNCKVDFTPAAGYSEPDEEEFLERCWVLYEAKAFKERKPLLNKNEENFATIRNTYGDAVRQQHAIDYLKEGTNAADLRVWVDKRVLELEQVGDKRKATSFRRYLDIAGERVTEEEREAAANRSNARRRTGGLAVDTDNCSSPNSGREDIRFHIVGAGGVGDGNAQSQPVDQLHQAGGGRGGSGVNPPRAQ